VSKKQESKLISFEIDVECPGCGAWSIDHIKVPEDQAAPLCVKRLCATCRNIQRRFD
jgi:endogenous inhibitor of DNA gyrase (YacG/DUF329 family)